MVLTKLYHSKSDLTKAHIQMHLSILLWGITGILGKSILLNEGLLVWYRLIIVSVSLAIAIYFSGHSFKISKRNVWRLSKVGVMLMLHWICFYGAIKYANVSITLSLLASTSLFTALLEPMMTKKKFDKSELLYSSLAILGISLIFYSDTNDYTVGIFLAIMAAFLGAFFNILNKNIVQEFKSSVVSFYEITSGLVVLTLLLPVYLYFFPTEKLLPSANDWMLLVVLAVLCTHVTLILSLNALKHLSAFTLNLAINLEPVYGIALAFLFFGENKYLNEGFFIGAAIIMCGVVFHAVQTNRKTKSLNTANP